MLNSPECFFCRVLVARAVAGFFLACAVVQGCLAEEVNAAYVVLGENGVAVARILTNEMQCPVIAFDAHSVPMELRAKPATMPLRPTRSAPADSKPADFSIRTCEKEIPLNTKQVMIGNVSLPLPPSEIKRIVVIGDTGCRLKKSENAYQACNDINRYPFAKVAAAAADWKPDLVIHVGDFQYRENACPADNPGCTGSPWGYGWDTWQADFFTPATPLLKAAPWVMVRGNHESCARAGQGWWRMLDPRPLLEGRDCDNAANDETGDYSDPYAIPLGNDAQLIVLDTSNTSGAVLAVNDIRRSKYRDTYHQLEFISQRANFNIVAYHHPLLGVFAERNKLGELVLQPGNQGLQSVFGEINSLMMPPQVNVLLSGHLHVWQEVSFSSPHPTQFVAGFSGTMEDWVSLPDQLPPDTVPAPGAVIEHHSSWAGGFGFMTMERKGINQWDVKVWDSTGRQLNRCDIDGRHSACDVTQVKQQ